MIEGIITKGVGGNYYVDIGNKLIECRARGLFRLQNIKPLVGDICLIRITEEDENSGYIEEIKERTNEIKRPPVANAQQLFIIFSVKNPQPSFLLLDKLLIAAELNNLKPVICFNKADLAEEGQKEYIQNTFKNTGYKIIFTSKYKSPAAPHSLCVFRTFRRRKIIHNECGAAGLLSANGRNKRKIKKRKTHHPPR